MLVLPSITYRFLTYKTMNPKNPLARRSVMLCTSLVGATSLLLTSCADTQDGRLTQAQGAGIGALGGAALGGLIGAASGNAGRGSLIGAALGGAGGFAYGTHVAHQKAKYKSTEEWLDACIAEAESSRRAAVAYNRKLDGRIASLQGEVQRAKASGNKGELQRLKQEIKQERIEAEKQVNSVNEEVKAQRSAINEGGNSSRVSALRSKTSSVSAEGAATKQKVQRLASLENQIGV